MKPLIILLFWLFLSTATKSVPSCISFNTELSSVINESNTEQTRPKYLKGNARVEIHEIRTYLEGNKVIRVDEESCSYNSTLIFRINFENLEFLLANSDKFKQDWCSMPVLEGDSFYREWDTEKNVTKISIMNPLKARMEYQTKGFRESNYENWGILSQGNSSNDITFQHAAASFLPYIPANSKSTGKKPDKYILNLVAVLIPENIKTRNYAETTAGERQEWDASLLKMVNVPPPYSVNVPYASDPFTDVEGIKSNPPLISAAVLDSFLLDPEGGLNTTLEGTVSKTANDVEYSISVKINLNLTPTTLAKADEDTNLELSGCYDIQVGEYAEVECAGKPDGGSYRFWIEPKNIFAVLPAGSTAVLQGLSPGKGTLYAEYTTPGGNLVSKSHEVSCLKIVNYNEGKQIPEVGLFNEQGLEASRLLKVPINAQPSNIEELVDFVSGDKSILTASGSDNTLEIFGKSTGVTTLQARTDCDKPVGPVVTVKVVNCSAETISKLAEEMRIAKEFQKQQLKEISEILGSKEFEDASGRIEESTKNLAIKTAGAIIGALANTPASQTAAGFYGIWSSLRDIFVRGGDTWTQVNNFSQLIIGLGQETVKNAAYLNYLGGLIAAKEAIDAADDFGKNLGELLAADSRLIPAMEALNNANRLIFEIGQRQRLCRTGKMEELTNYVPPVLAPPTQIGFPYYGSGCGCQEQKSVGLSAEGLGDIQSGMTNLGNCVEGLQGSLTDYVNSLESWKVLCESLSAAIKSGPDELNKVAKESVPQLEEIMGSARALDEAGKSFLKEFESCSGTLKSSIELIKSAKNIDVNSIGN